MMTETARRVRIDGRVQGVSFRAWTQAKAESLGLRGWVRNEADGSVLAHVEGATEGIGTMLAAFREGPPTALVEEVEAQEVPPEGLADFRVDR